MKQVVYTKKSLFCWVASSVGEEDQTKNLAILLIFEGVPLLGGLIVTTFGYAKAIKNAKDMLGSFVSEVHFNIYKLLWYPLVLFIVFIPSFIDNILQVYYGKNIFWVEVVHLALTHSIGLFNAIVYGIQKKENFVKNDPETFWGEKKDSMHSHLSRSMAEDLIRASSHDVS